MHVSARLGSLAALAALFDVFFVGPRRSTRPCPQFASSSSAPQVFSGARWAFEIGYHEHKGYSQNGEDGVLEYIFRNIGTTNKYYVEFGVESGVECNTRYLREKHGWSGLLMDGGHEDASRNLRKEVVLPSNVVQLFRKHGVPTRFDLLSVDTDMLDFWVLEEILSSSFVPRAIVVEINSKIVPGSSLVVPNSAEPVYWSGSDFFGASISAFFKLGQKFNYTMVYCESMGVNCFLLHDTLVGGSLRDVLTPALLYRPPRYGDRLCGHKASGRLGDFVRVDPQGDRTKPEWYSFRCG